MAGRVLGRRRQQRGERRWEGSRPNEAPSTAPPPPVRPQQPAASTAPRCRRPGPGRSGPGCAAGIGSGLTDDTPVLLCRIRTASPLPPAGLRPRGGDDRLRSGQQRPDPAHARGGCLRVVAELLRHQADAAICTELPHDGRDRLGHSAGSRRIRSLQARGEQRRAPGIARGRLRGGELARPGGCRRMNDEGHGGHGVVLLFLTFGLHQLGRGARGSPIPRSRLGRLGGTQVRCAGPSEASASWPVLPDACREMAARGARYHQGGQLGDTGVMCTHCSPPGLRSRAYLDGGSWLAEEAGPSWWLVSRGRCAPPLGWASPESAHSGHEVMPVPASPGMGR